MARVRTAPLDRTAVVDAAVDLIDRDGLDGVSMRRLAKELGVEAMSLYHHVRNKEDLIDACIEHVAASMDLSGMEAPGPWRMRLKAGFHGYRALAHAHPHLFALVGHRPVRRLEVLRPVEAALGVFTDAGFSPAQAIRAFRIVNSFVYGYALSELNGLAVRTTSADTVADDPTDFPNLVQALPLAAEADPDAEFQHGLDTILDAIARWPRVPSGDEAAGEVS